MSDFHKAVLKVAKSNPEFRQALQEEMSKTAGPRSKVGEDLFSVYHRYAYTVPVERLGSHGGSREIDKARAEVEAELRKVSNVPWDWSRGMGAKPHLMRLGVALSKFMMELGAHDAHDQALQDDDDVEDDGYLSMP